MELASLTPWDPPAPVVPIITPNVTTQRQAGTGEWCGPAVVEMLWCVWRNCLPAGFCFGACFFDSAYTLLPHLGLFIFMFIFFSMGRKWHLTFTPKINDIQSFLPKALRNLYHESQTGVLNTLWGNCQTEKLWSLKNWSLSWGQKCLMIYIVFRLTGPFCFITWRPPVTSRSAWGCAILSRHIIISREWRNSGFCHNHNPIVKMLGDWQAAYVNCLL